MRLLYAPPFIFYRLAVLCCALWVGVAVQPARAQTGGRRMLRGSVSMTGESPQAYIIYFSTTGTKISGKSVTAQRSGQPLTAAITGQLNAARTEMYLKETHSLDPRGLNGFTYYCFFTARLKLTQQGNRRIWIGQFISTAEDGGPCGGGTMRFEDLPAPPEPTPPRPQPQPAPTPPPVAARPVAPRPTPPRPRPRPDTARRAVRPVPPRDTARPVVVVVDTPKPPPIIPLPDTVGLKPLYTWTSDTLGIEVWDGYQEDGDVVSLLFNGREIMPRQTLSRDKKMRFSLPLSERSIDTLSVMLHAEGSEKPCTPRMVVFDGTGQRDLDIAGAAGQTAVLYFKRWK